MGLKNIFGKFSDSGSKEEEYVELDLGTTEPASSVNKVTIQVEKLESYSDSDRIQRKLREGNILLVGIKGLKEKDMSELKRAIERIRKTCLAINGDIAGVSDEWVIICPEFAKVHREKAVTPVSAVVQKRPEAAGE